MGIIVSYLIMVFITSYSILVLAEVKGWDTGDKYPAAVVGGLFWPIAVVIMVVHTILTSMDRSAANTAKRIKNRRN